MTNVADKLSREQSLVALREMVAQWQTDKISAEDRGVPFLLLDAESTIAALLSIANGDNAGGISGAAGARRVDVVVNSIQKGSAFRVLVASYVATVA